MSPKSTATPQVSQDSKKPPRASKSSARRVYFEEEKIERERRTLERAK